MEKVGDCGKHVKSESNLPSGRFELKIARVGNLKFNLPPRVVSSAVPRGQQSRVIFQPARNRKPFDWPAPGEGNLKFRKAIFAVGGAVGGVFHRFGGGGRSGIGRTSSRGDVRQLFRYEDTRRDGLGLACRLE